MTTGTIPTPDQLAAATAQHFPHYAIQFPPWNQLQLNKLPDNVTTAPSYDLGHHQLSCTTELASRLANVQKAFPKETGHLDAQRGNEQSANSEQPPGAGDPLKLVPHPGSDCRHVDPGQAGGNFRPRFRAMLQELKDLNEAGKGDGELVDRLGRALQSIGDTDDLLADGKPGQPGRPGPRGMQRLRLIFQWALCQVITVFGEINAALVANDKDAYERACAEYLRLLRDLDDREPHTKPGQMRPGISGYGRVVKWFYVLPLIHEGRIKGAKVVAKWNPHISSSGIPIPHS